MKPTPSPLNQYHVFLASPGDVGQERQHVRRFFDAYNRHTAHIWRARFEVVDWENYASTGVGRPQELITKQTLERYRESLALVIGVMAQRFGSPSGKAESGTEEEFNWAMDSNKASGFPEVKWFFRRVDKLELPSDPDEADAALDQWKKVRAFRKRMQDLDNPVFYAEYPSVAGFPEVFDRDLNQWLADPARPWAAELAAHVAAIGGAEAVALPAEFDAERYRLAVLKRFDTLNFEMLDTTGAFYSAVRLWTVFVPQSVRECHQYNPRLLEIPKEHQRRLLEAGEVTAKELEETWQQADRLRQDYFGQPLRPVVEVADEALRGSPTASGRKLVILGDPGSGKSSLMRYLALRWAGIAESTVRDTQPVPLVIELGAYARWQCDGRKDFIRYLEEGPVWHVWHHGLLSRMLEQPGRFVLLLDGLDEVFDVPTRGTVVNDIQRFAVQFAAVSIIMTSRVVGYQAQQLREADFQHLMLQDLDATQITDFLNRWHEVTFDDPVQATPKRERLQKAIRESKSIAMLAGNPLLLTMMAILNRNQELPRDRADLYAQTSRVLLHQWDTERALVDFPGMNTEIGLREKTEILRRIAAHMQAGPGGLKGNLVDGETLTGLIEAYLQDELHFAQARAAARAVVDQLRQRNFILCFVGADSYAFVHRTFLEYFCAADFVYQFNVAKTLGSDDLIALFEEHCRDDEWHEVLRLICGQIDETSVGRIVERLATMPHPELWAGPTALPEILLAIGCLSELRNPSQRSNEGAMLIQKVARLASRGHISETLVRSAMDLGDRWPGKSAILAYRDPAGRSLAMFPEPWSWDAAGLWVRFIAVVTGDRDWVTSLTRTGHDGYRGGALQALAEMWPDLTTRKLLARRAVQDDSPSTRLAALSALAEKWPDTATRNLLARRAVKDEAEVPRRGALQTLTEKWPDQATRDLLAIRAVADPADVPRRAALRALAGRWPDQATRDLLMQRAVEDEDIGPREAALHALAERWPDQVTRDFLIERAVHDEQGGPRETALYALADGWRDQTTRDLLTERVVHDVDGAPRRAAMAALAELWPDQISRELVAKRAVEDSQMPNRRVALQLMAVKWPNQTTRDLLSLRALQDGDGGPRAAALMTLAEKWPGKTTRALLVQRAVQDDDGGPRGAALVALAEKWPDQATRDLLARRAVEDGDSGTRRAALRELATRWTDQVTRNLLADRAVLDVSDGPRCAALQMLAEKWPDQATRNLLSERAVMDHDSSTRGAACSALGKMHSEFGHILPTRDLDGYHPYIDPREPIRREHIERAAAKAGIPPSDLVTQIDSLSAHFGWDLRIGARAKSALVSARPRPGRKRRP